MQAYVDMFSRSLAVELWGTGVTVQNMAPLFVATKMSKIRRPRVDAPSPKVWVRAALRDLGHDVISCPYWYHGLQRAVIASLPVGVVNWYVRWFHLGLRQRYYKKLQKAK